MTDFFFFYCSQTASSGSSQTIGAKTFMETDFFPNNRWQCYKKTDYVKFGRSEKGTKFEKIFHFQFDITKLLLF